MKISKEARKVSRELFQASLQDGRIDGARVLSIARKLGESKPRHYIDILHAFERLVRLELARRHAVIESATELDETTRTQLQSSLQQKYGSDVTTVFQVVPALIGGLRIKVGSDVFDSSVRERLSHLQAQALHA
jgi:F-type H+-transporting ATPase subunit delta